MATKEQLRTSTLLDRGMTRTQDEHTKRFSVVDSAVDNTPLMLDTEGVTGTPIQTILLMQMSTRRLAQWVSHEIGRPVTQATIVNWRRRFKITRQRRTTYGAYSGDAQYYGSSWHG